MLKRFWDYTSANLDIAKKGHAKTILVCGIIFFIIVGVYLVSGYVKPDMTKVSVITYGISIVVFAIGFFTWIPFSRHEADKAAFDVERKNFEAGLANLAKTHDANALVLRQQIAELKKQITDDSIKLNIDPHVEIIPNGSGKTAATIIIKVVNTGNKIARILRVVLDGATINHSVLNGAGDPTIQLISSEMIAHQKGFMVEIQPHGGIHVWQITCVRDPNLKMEERDGDKYGSGYVEFTDNTKQVFNNLLLPHDILPKLGQCP